MDCDAPAGDVGHSGLDHRFRAPLRQSCLGTRHHPLAWTLVDGLQLLVFRAERLGHRILSSRSLGAGLWKDEGCIFSSREHRDNWNAIDPNFVIDGSDQPWLVWGSFWDGIQMARLDSTMHIAAGERPRTIARRYDPGFTPSEPNPTSRYAGTNAIEAPFIFKHDGYYYLFVSWDYCCRGAQSNYRVAVGRSRQVDGPYLDHEGLDMAKGGGTLFLEGDKKEWEAAGHCAVYNFDGQDIFICHGYSATQNGAALLIQRSVGWTPDGWPQLLP